MWKHCDEAFIAPLYRSEAGRGGTGSGQDGPGEVYSCRPGIRHTAALEGGEVTSKALGYCYHQKSMMQFCRDQIRCLCVCDALSLSWQQLISSENVIDRQRERKRVGMKERWTSCSLMLIFQDRAAWLNKINKITIWLSLNQFNLI